MKSMVRQLFKCMGGVHLIITELLQGRMAMIRPWLSANFLGSKIRSAQPAVRYQYFEPDKPGRRPAGMNKQNPLLNLLRSEMELNIF